MLLFIDTVNALSFNWKICLRWFPFNRLYIISTITAKQFTSFCQFAFRNRGYIYKLLNCLNMYNIHCGHICYTMTNISDLRREPMLFVRFEQHWYTIWSTHNAFNVYKNNSKTRNLYRVISVLNTHSRTLMHTSRRKQVPMARYIPLPMISNG